jgi:predicted glycosyltransferase
MNLGGSAQISGLGESMQSNDLLRRPRPVRINDETPSRRPRVVLFSDDPSGLGHLRRNMHIGTALAQSSLRASSIAIASSMEAGLFPSPAGVDWMTLPLQRAGSTGSGGERSLSAGGSGLAKVRSNAIAAVIESFEPDLFIVDRAPTGVDHELIGALEAARSMPGTSCVLGLPDVLGKPDAVRDEWAKHSYEAAIERYYDEVWVYGDPRVCDLETEYDLSSNTASKLQYTGYFDTRRSDAERAEDCSDVLPFVDGAYQVSLCLAGAGTGGAPLAMAFAATALPEDSVGIILLGPLMDSEERRAIKAAARANRRLAVIDFLPDPRPLIERADYVVTAGGYNTIAELMSYEKPTLVVPAASTSSEQRVRAERWSDLDMLDMAPAERVTPEYLGRWLIDVPRPCSARSALDFTGSTRLVELVEAGRMRRDTRLGVIAERRCA